LLIAAYLYLLGYAIGFIGHLVEDQWINAIGSIVLFGTGICFFQIFWHLGEHMKRLEEMAEG
jgi:cytochrome c biogenesis protein CcdA